MSMDSVNCNTSGILGVRLYLKGFCWLTYFFYQQYQKKPNECFTVMIVHMTIMVWNFSVLCLFLSGCLDRSDRGFRTFACGGAAWDLAWPQGQWSMYQIASLSNLLQNYRKIITMDILKRLMSDFLSIFLSLLTSSSSLNLLFFAPRGWFTQQNTLRRNWSRKWSCHKPLEETWYMSQFTLQWVNGSRMNIFHHLNHKFVLTQLYFIQGYTCCSSSHSL